MNDKRAVVGFLCLGIVGAVAWLVWLVRPEPAASQVTSHKSQVTSRKEVNPKTQPKPEPDPIQTPAQPLDPALGKPQDVAADPPKPVQDPQPKIETPQNTAPSSYEPYAHKPQYVAKPVENEPAWLSPDDAEALKKAGYSAFSGGYMFDIKGADGKRSAGVVISGIVLMSRGYVELFCCGEGGKEHESVLRVTCDIQQLDSALRLCGLKPGRIPQTIGDADQGSRLVALAQWPQEGKPVTYYSEDLLISGLRDARWPRVGWTYVGDWAELDDPANPKKKYRVLEATGTRSLIATYHNQQSLLDNPLRQGIKHREDDPFFVANHELLPPRGTKVLVMLRPATEKETTEIATLEEEMSK
jgi:hypothetical protein